MTESAVIVTKNVMGLTLIIMGLYPCLYIIRYMVNFVSNAFDQIANGKYFSKLGGKKK